MTTVIKIIADHLRNIGADGLCAEDCGCELSNLAPCGGFPASCKPGWKGADNESDTGPDAWLMFGSKEAADASMKDGAA